MAPAVVIARLIPAVGRDRIAAVATVLEGGLDASAEEIAAMVPGAVAIVPDPTVAVGAELLEAAGPDLRLVANFGVGYDNLDLDACRERGVLATNTPDVLTDATAELALALTLAAARGTGAAEARLRAGRWTGFDTTGDLGIELSGARFGILGMGRIGRRYAELVAPLAGELLYFNRSPAPEAEETLGARRVELDELLGGADVVSLHLPGGSETSHLIGAAELAAMKPSAILVNTARGTLVDGAALARALGADDGIAAAGLDVYEQEPAVPQALLEAPGCVLLPHVGSATVRARDGMSNLVADAVCALLEGVDPPNRIA